MGNNWGMTDTPETPHLLHDFEAAAVLRMTTRAVRRLAKQDAIPYVLLADGEPRFDPVALWAWLDQFRRGPRPAADPDLEGDR